MPAQKQGAYIVRYPIYSLNCKDAANANAAIQIHQADHLRRSINRAGSTKYIWTSNGKDHSGPRMESCAVTFWTNRRLERTVGCEGVRYRDFQESAGILSARADSTIKMLRG